VRGGATAAARALRRSRRVLLTTGFMVGPGLPETDGPPGAACLGRALRALGADVTYVTDAAALPPLQASLKVLGEPASVQTFHVPHAAGGGPEPGAARDVARRLLAEYRPTHLVSIERPGRARDGQYRSARGQSLTEWNGPLDELFLAAPARTVTIGIGDGGNEIGMGNLKSVIPGLPKLPTNPCVTTTKELIIASCSNWGGYGLVAQMSLMTGKNMLPSVEQGYDWVKATVEAGAVEGMSGERKDWVDARSPEDDAVCLRDLHDFLRAKGL